MTRRIIVYSLLLIGIGWILFVCLDSASPYALWMWHSQNLIEGEMIPRADAVFQMKKLQIALRDEYSILIIPAILMLAGGIINGTKTKKINRTNECTLFPAAGRVLESVTPALGVNENMNIRLLFCLICICIAGCNMGHPKKTDKTVSEADLVGTWTYRNELTLTLNSGGVGTQPFENMTYRIKWSLTDDNHIKLNNIRYRFGSNIKRDDFEFIISDDYRDHFYFFGGPVDFDNYEIWDKKQ